MKPSKNPESDIARTLGIDRASGNRRRLFQWLIVAFLVIVAIAAFFIWKGTRKANSMQYKTQEAQRGDLTVTVTATGNLQPTNQVDVGSELSGIIESVEVNYNDRVKVGQVLARLDTEKLEAQVLQSQADLASARANVLQVQATIAETSGALNRLKQVYELSNKKVPSRHELDAAEAAFKRA